MRCFSRLALGLAGATVLVSSAMIPASAAENIAVSANVAGQGLQIDVPDANSLAFGQVVPGASPTRTLTGVTVTDLRAKTTPWSASVSINGFSADGTQSVEGFTLGYNPGAALFTSGVGVPGLPTNVPSVSTDATKVQQPTSVLGNNVAKWNATVTLNVPGTALEGSYKTTLTHSVL